MWNRLCPVIKLCVCLLFLNFKIIWSLNLNAFIESSKLLYSKLQLSKNGNNSSDLIKKNKLPEFTDIFLRDIHIFFEKSLHLHLNLKTWPCLTKQQDSALLLSHTSSSKHFMNCKFRLPPLSHFSFCVEEQSFPLGDRLPRRARCGPPVCGHRSECPLWVSSFCFHTFSHVWTGCGLMLKCRCWNYAVFLLWQTTMFSRNVRTQSQAWAKRKRLCRRS